MLTRLISSNILAMLAVIAVILGGGWLLALYGTGFMLAAYEYYNMTRLGGHRPLWIPALVLIAALSVNASLHPQLPFDFTTFILVLAAAIPPLWELSRTDHQGFLLNWALMLLGVVYIGLLGTYTFRLRNLQDGAALLFIPLLGIWLTDIFAYLAGRLWGKTPFFPDISPKKTRQGAIGGIIAGTLTVGILGWVFGMPVWASFLCGVCIAVLTTAGDLTESLIKRNLGVKDSGTLIAGHGGVFDRLDSMFIPLAFAYFFFTVVLGYR
ncbi:MAG: phosphatidate cytidylyltransferase [Chloroflexi bacterium]|nr:phosphatidate cytidylyltransferase [Chloroflexota bacterium]